MNLVSVGQGETSMTCLWELNGKYVVTIHHLLVDLSMFSLGWSNLSGTMEIGSYLANSEGHIMTSISPVKRESATNFEEIHKQYAASAFEFLPANQEKE